MREHEDWSQGSRGSQPNLFVRGNVVSLEPMKTFADVIESVESLSLDEQEELVSIVKRRLREQRRAELVRMVRAARKEFRSGRCQPALPDEIMRKITA